MDIAINSLYINALQLWHFICSRYCNSFNINYKLMKKYIIILVMLLMAATSFNQSSRRTANSPKNARDENNDRKVTNNADNSRTRKPEINSSRKSADNKSGTNAGRAVTRTEKQPNNTVKNNVRRDNSDNNHTYSKNTAQRKVDVKSDRGNAYSGSRRTPNGNNNANYSAINRNTVNNDSRRTVNANNRAVHYPSSRKYIDSRPVKYSYHHAPRSREYRARIYPYRRPHRINIYWTNAMRLEYYRIYPVVKWWSYPIGYRIPTITAYDASFYAGEVINVYGKIYEVFYSRSTDEYFAYIGAYYPYHDFTVVIPGWIARKYSNRPERYFEREHMIVTGLITFFNEGPEIVVKNPGQIKIY